MGRDWAGSGWDSTAIQGSTPGPQPHPEAPALDLGPRPCQPVSPPDCPPGEQNSWAFSCHSWGHRKDQAGLCSLGEFLEWRTHCGHLEWHTSPMSARQMDSEEKEVTWASREALACGVRALREPRKCWTSSQGLTWGSDMLPSSPTSNEACLAPVEKVWLEQGCQVPATCQPSMGSPALAHLGPQTRRPCVGREGPCCCPLLHAPLPSGSGPTENSSSRWAGQVYPSRGRSSRWPLPRPGGQEE